MTGTNELPHEPRFRFDADELDALLGQWRELGRECLRSAREFARERPTETLVLAFLAGTFLGAFLGRR